MLFIMGYTSKKLEIMVKYKPLSKEYLLKRGYCCNNGCKNCPYNKKLNKYGNKSDDKHS